MQAVVKGGAVDALAFPVYYYQYPRIRQQLCILQCIATSLFFGTKDFQAFEVALSANPKDR